MFKTINTIKNKLAKVFRNRKVPNESQSKVLINDIPDIQAEEIFVDDPQLGNESIAIKPWYYYANDLKESEFKGKRLRKLFWRKKKSQRKRGFK